MKTHIRSIILLSAVLLAGCGEGLSGTYTQTGGLMSGMVSGRMTFISSSKVDIELNGVTAECSYEKNGDQLKLISGDKNQVLTIDKEGCLDGGEIMGKFCKEK